MITYDNILQEYPKLSIKLPKQLSKEEFETLADMHDLYNDDDDIKKYIDKFITLLNMEILKTKGGAAKLAPEKKAESKPGPAKTPKKQPASSSTKKRASKAPASTKKEPKYVESIDLEVAFMKSFALMHNKRKTLAQLTSLLVRLKKAILKKQIRSNSVFAADINKMIDGLESLIAKMKSSKADAADIQVEDFEKYKEIGNSEKVLKSVSFIIRYLGLVNKPNIDTRAEKLLNDISNAEAKKTLDNKYSDTISFIKKNLSKYNTNKSLLDIPETQLQGLMSGLSGFGLGSIFQEMYSPVSQSNGTVTADELAKMDFDTIEMPSEYRGLIGKAERGGSVMIYGDPGSGKSSLAVKMAKGFSLAGKKVLYITKEEGVNATMKEKLVRYGATSPNITISENIPSDLSDYYCVIFDSVQTLRLTPDDIMKHKRFNNHIRLYIFQVTKDGKFRGGEDFAHNVDCVLYAEKGVITSFGQKNRFGGRGSMRVYDSE